MSNIFIFAAVLAAAFLLSKLKRKLMQNGQRYGRKITETILRNCTKKLYNRKCRVIISRHFFADTHERIKNIAVSYMPGPLCHGSGHALKGI